VSYAQQINLCAPNLARSVAFNLRSETRSRPTTNSATNRQSGGRATLERRAAQSTLEPQSIDSQSCRTRRGTHRQRRRRQRTHPPPKEDADVSVRAMAAFALGEIESE